MNNKIPYIEQLEQNEWKSKRKEILERDKEECRSCGLKRSEIISVFQDAKLKTSQEIVNEGFQIVMSEKKDTVLLLSGMDKEEVPILKPSGEIHKMNSIFGYRYGKKVPFTYRTIERFAVKNNYDFSNEMDLNIHHTYYQVGKLAWEYPNDALISLCSNCHQHEHDTKEIPVYSTIGKKLCLVEKCERCGGSGHFKEYKHVKNGVCFKCNGTGDNIQEVLNHYSETESSN